VDREILFSVRQGVTEGERATEPDARVTFQGRPIPLNPDGTFSFRFALPDGKQNFPIHATNADGDLSRSIEFVVSRETRKGRE
jgi:hypothetical protein